MDVRTDAIVIRSEGSLALVTQIAEEGFLKAIWGRTDCRVRTIAYPVEGQRRTHFSDLNRVHALLDGIDHHSAGSTVSDIGVIDVLAEDTFIFEIESPCGFVEVSFEQQSTPIPSGWSGGWLVIVKADRFVEPRGEEDVTADGLAVAAADRIAVSIEQFRSTEDLQCTTAAVNP